ncbi:MAG TPA: PQQ-dependent sugar dehydrogenase [Casimicrobiaceae bacterium]|jgi:glucose/arabinose dehydrogenase
MVASALALAAVTAHAQTRLLPAITGLQSPVDVTHAHDATLRLFIVEQAGRIRIAKDGQLLATPFLDLTSSVQSGGEQGLLGLAFHPRFRDNGLFFVNYTRRNDGATVIVRYRVSASDPDRADPASVVQLIVFDQPFANHNGGALKFGPDGYLYVATGDGGSANDPGNRAQNTFEWLGKLLRIDVDHGATYTIPLDNPFANGLGGRPEVWAYGLRNPWRTAFDRQTGDLYIADVGQDMVEEVDFVPAGTGAGTNFGWRVMEGSRCTGLGGGPACGASTLTLPIAEYAHAFGCSIIGGTVYRGTQVPSLFGRYVYGDLCSGTMWSVARDAQGTWTVRHELATGLTITSFGEDETGELYVASADDGAVYRIAAGAASSTVNVIEYYHAALDHYFITTLPIEIAKLDDGILTGWTRTGQAFHAYASAEAGTSPVCRLYIPPANGDSQFLSASPTECATTKTRFPQFIDESDNVMWIGLPDVATGACPVGEVSVYRLWNQRGDSNHRYVTDLALRAQMLGQGYVPEGYGNGVAMCAPP